MAETKIEWCDFTFNPWRGCTKVSAGCANCYADTMSKRNPGTLGVWGPNGTRVVAAESYWRQPVKWNREAAEAKDRYDFACANARSEYDEVGEWHRPRVFCASLADVFEDWSGSIHDCHDTEVCICNECGKWMNYEDHECSPECRSDRAPRRLTLEDVRRRLFKLIDATPNLDWLLLTKRPENVRRMWHQYGPPKSDDISLLGKPLHRENVWLGTSVEDQSAADKRIPELLKCRDLAPVLFLSCEPLLGPLNLSEGLQCESCIDRSVHWCGDPVIDWVIAGGESGHGARPCNTDWIRNILDQCEHSSVACFIKQLGSNAVEFPTMIDCQKIHTADRKGGDMNEWPEDLRVRQFPHVNHAGNSPAVL